MNRDVIEGMLELGYITAPKRYAGSPTAAIIRASTGAFHSNYVEFGEVEIQDRKSMPQFLKLGLPPDVMEKLVTLCRLWGRKGYDSSYNKLDEAQDSQLKDSDNTQKTTEHNSDVQVANRKIESFPKDASDQKKSNGKIAIDKESGIYKRKLQQSTTMPCASEDHIEDKEQSRVSASCRPPIQRFRSIWDTVGGAVTSNQRIAQETGKPTKAIRDLLGRDERKDPYPMA